MLNDIAKRSVSDRLIKSMGQEKLTPKETAEGFGFSACYVSMIKNSDQWKKCPNHTWETVLAWVNSGDTLHSYFKRPHIVLRETELDVKIKEAEIFEEKPEEGIKFDSILDPLELITEELKKADRSLIHSANDVRNRKIDVELHLRHVKNLIPKIQKLQDAIIKLS